MRKSFRDVPHAYDDMGLQIIYLDGPPGGNDSRARIRMENRDGTLAPGCKACGYAFVYFNNVSDRYCCEMCGSLDVMAGPMMTTIGRYVRNAS